MCLMQICVEIHSLQQDIDTHHTPVDKKIGNKTIELVLCSFKKSQELHLKFSIQQNY